MSIERTRNFAKTNYSEKTRKTKKNKSFFFLSSLFFFVPWRCSLCSFYKHLYIESKMLQVEKIPPKLQNRFIIQINSRWTWWLNKHIMGPQPIKKNTRIKKRKRIKGNSPENHNWKRIMGGCSKQKSSTDHSSLILFPLLKLFNPPQECSFFNTCFEKQRHRNSSKTHLLSEISKNLIYSCVFRFYS